MTSQEQYNRLIVASLAARREVLETVREIYLEMIPRLASMIVTTIDNGNKILICGNGGSAAESQHFAAEMVVRLTSAHTTRALPAIALSTDTSILTAAANDFGFDAVFARQVAALGRGGDLLVALSTSGGSENVNRAVRTARELGMATGALCGGDGGELARLADVAIVIPSSSILRIQEEHLYLLHQVAELVCASLTPRE